MTAEVRSLFRAMFERLAPDAEEWIRKTAEGEVSKPDKEGKVRVLVDPDPGKAADLLLRLAEFHVPKLARVEKGIPDASDEELLQEIRRRKAEAEKAGEG